jgi:hypothetical protein
MNWESMLNRLFFVGAFVLLALAVLERIVNAFGYTIILGSFRPGRLLEFSAILLLFVTVLVLRQVRDEMRSRPS